MVRPGASGTIETVTGPIAREDVTCALAHEHLFVDFRGPADPEYGRVDGDEVRAGCERRLMEAREVGVDLLVDCTPIGIGRNVQLLRDLSRSTGIRIVCATGIYRALRPPELASASGEELTDLFTRELTAGIDDTGVRAGFIKIATTDTGPTGDETIVHRAGGRAAAATGVAIVLHSPRADAAEIVLRTLEAEGFDPARLVWAHAQESSLGENLRLAARGVVVSYDAIGTSDDQEMLDRISHLAAASCGDRIVLSSDSSFVVRPADLAYERNLTYLHRTFASKVEARLGRELREAVTLGNVFRAFERAPAS